MAGVQHGLFPQAKSVAPRVAHGSINATRVVMGILLLMIAVAAIGGTVLAAMNGQNDLAIIIGILAAAFFSRVLC